MENKNIAVIGGGSWATAIVKILTESLPQVHWYMRSKEAIEHIKKDHHNLHYLSSVKFDPKQLILTDNINTAVEQADYLIFVIPSAFLYSELEKLKRPLKDKVIYSAIKGIVPETGLLVGEHFHHEYEVPYENIGVISGPCHAEEVALGRLSYLTIACPDEKKAQFLADIFDNDYIRCIVSKDVIGTEYAAMLKNIYAIAAGMYHALGYGDNFQSVLMSNAIRETERFIKNIDKTDRDINDSAYLGDLLVTGYSSFSRNRMFGTMIGKGYTVKNAKLEMSMVAEGYYAAKCAYVLNSKLSKPADIPIIEAVYKILYENKNPSKIMFDLTRKLY